MLTWEALVEAQALRNQGWSISAIARHLDVTRVTVRRYLNGEATPGQRARASVDPFEEYVQYCRLRLAMIRICGRRRCSTRSSRWAIAGSYQSFTRGVRRRGSCGRGARRAPARSPAGTGR